MGARYRKFRDEPLVRQWILQDHMRNHYRKLEIVKPRTSSSFPKQNRSKNATFSCPCCSRLTKLGEDRLTDSLTNLSIASLEHRLTALETCNKAPFRSSRTQVSPCHSAPSQINSQRASKPTTQHRSLSVTDSDRPPFSTNWTEQREQLQKTVQSGDLLERHAHYFRNPPAPFTPKTLRKVAQSKLVGSRNYNPPRYLEASYPQQSTRSHNSENDSTTRRNASPEKSYSDKEAAEELHSQSRSAGVRVVKKKLYDGDKQTSHSGYRMRPLERSKADSSSGRNSSGRDSAYGEVSSISSRNATPAGKFWEGHESPLQHETNDVWFKDHFGKWVDKQEHEHKYLTFLCEVTADLLTRGLCTNKKIKEVISWHIKRKRKVLNPECVASLMQQLCLDLQVPWDNKHDGEFYGCRTPERNKPEDDKPNTARDDLMKISRWQQPKQVGPDLSKENNYESAHFQRGAETSDSPHQPTYSQSRPRATHQDDVKSSIKREKSYLDTGYRTTARVASSFDRDREPSCRPELLQRGNYEDKWSNVVENTCIPNSSPSLKESSPVARTNSDYDFIPNVKPRRRNSNHSDTRSQSSSRASSVYYNKGDEASYNEPRSPMRTAETVPPAETEGVENDYTNDNYTDDDISEVMELGSSNSDTDSNINQG